MKDLWMLRAGQGAGKINDFLMGEVSIGWPEMGDLAGFDKAQIKKRYVEVYDQTGGAAPNAIAIIYKFLRILKKGAQVVTYNPANRQYHLGEITGEYEYREADADGHGHFRKVRWEGTVNRDDLSASARYSLGSTLALFSINADVGGELNDALKGKVDPESEDNKKQDLETVRETLIESALGMIQDRILKLSDRTMEDLAAAILRAMGYRTKISPPGPDRGVDVIASPDGLGLESPRIKVEVKHRPKEKISAPSIRSFVGGLREGDRAIYISTGGFSKDAKYEADRANFPLSLVDLNELTELVVKHYENFDQEGRILIPLVRLYWPVD